MIDKDGYRANVGIVICNRSGQVLWARRVRQNSWQFPQGGLDAGETPEAAMYRELYEELGLKKEDVRLLTSTKFWIKYRLPKRLVRWEEKPVCIGQKQKWYLLGLKQEKANLIEFDTKGHPEFDDWRWVSYWYPVRQVIPFKRDVYRRILTVFSGYALFGQSDKKTAKHNKRGKK